MDRTFSIRHRAISTIMEELEAIDWYDQRIKASANAELQASCAQSQRGEGTRSMLLEWLRRHDARIRRRTCERICSAKDRSARRASGRCAIPAAGGGLSIGSLKGRTMNHLYRELAPISDAAWQEIEKEATRTLKTTLAARKLVDFVGPQGLAGLCRRHRPHPAGRTAAAQHSRSATAPGAADGRTARAIRDAPQRTRRDRSRRPGSGHRSGHRGGPQHRHRRGSRDLPRLSGGRHSRDLRGQRRRAVALER